MTFDFVLGGLTALVLMAYLGYALVHSERF